MGKIRHSPEGWACRRSSSCFAHAGGLDSLHYYLGIPHPTLRPPLLQYCAMGWRILEDCCCCLRVFPMGVELLLLMPLSRGCSKRGNPAALRLRTTSRSILSALSSESRALLWSVRMSIYRVSGTSCQSRAACAGAVGVGICATPPLSTQKLSLLVNWVQRYSQAVTH